MTTEQFYNALKVPSGKVDVILDTDTYNEIDDQFALSYLIRSGDKLSVRAFCAAPFFNSHSSSPADGMEKSYAEILNLLTLAGEEELKKVTYRGSDAYLPDAKTPVDSDSARAIVRIASEYTPDRPLYVVAIGAITNVASALLLDPSIAEKIVVVWLGGHAYTWRDTAEFNMMQDVPAAQVVFDSGVPLVLLPCMGVVSSFTVSKPELEYWFKGKNALSDYLAAHAIEEADSYAKGKPWTRVIWDVTAVAWLLNDGDRFMKHHLTSRPIPMIGNRYAFDNSRPQMVYVDFICRDALLEDLIGKLTK